MTTKIQNKMRHEVMNYHELRKGVLVLRAMNHKLRQKMLEFLEDQVEATVTQVCIKLRLEQSVASQHLAILRRAGVVTTERQGKFIYYSINHDRLNQIRELVGELAE